MRTEVSSAQRLLLATVFVFFLAEVLGGALRYGAVMVGLAPLVYLPKVWLVAALVGTLLEGAIRMRISAPYLGVLVLMAVGVLQGYATLGNKMQVVFGLWVLAPFLSGVVALPALIKVWPWIVRYVFALWILAIVGVLVNVFYRWPWTGFEYTFGNVVIEGSRAWSFLGIVRLAGFSRVSSAVADQILVMTAVLLLLGRGRWRVFVWVLAGLTLLPTTSKTSIGVYAILTLFWLAKSRVPQILWQQLPLVLMTLVFAVPFSSLVIDYDLTSILKGPVRRLLLTSFGARLELAWPDALQMVVEHGDAVLGRGIGGIGAAQHYFEPTLYTPSDNLVVHIYALLGVLGLLLVAFYAFGLGLLKLRDRTSVLVFSLGVGVILSGITKNVMESSILGFAFGASLCNAIGVLLSRARPKTATYTRADRDMCGEKAGYK